jgi:hypothetical protein
VLAGKGALGIQFTDGPNDPAVDQALRSYLTALDSVSPALSDIFVALFEDLRSARYTTAEKSAWIANPEAWFTSSIARNPAGETDASLQATIDVFKDWQELGSTVKSLVESLFGWILRRSTALFDSISSWLYPFLDPEAQFEFRERNMAANELALLNVRSMSANRNTEFMNTIAQHQVYRSEGGVSQFQKDYNMLQTGYLPNGYDTTWTPKDREVFEQLVRIKAAQNYINNKEKTLLEPDVKSGRQRVTFTPSMVESGIMDSSAVTALRTLVSTKAEKFDADTIEQLREAQDKAWERYQQFESIPRTYTPEALMQRIAMNPKLFARDETSKSLFGLMSKQSINVYDVKELWDKPTRSKTEQEYWDAWKALLPDFLADLAVREYQKFSDIGEKIMKESVANAAYHAGHEASGSPDNKASVNVVQHRRNRAYGQGLSAEWMTVNAINELLAGVYDNLVPAAVTEAVRTGNPTTVSYNPQSGKIIIEVKVGNNTLTGEIPTLLTPGAAGAGFRLNGTYDSSRYNVTTENIPTTPVHNGNNSMPWFPNSTGAWRMGRGR